MADTRIQQVKAMIQAAFVPFRPELGPHRVLFFGSRVSGKARPRSDFDVAIDGPRPVDPTLLCRIGEALDELPTLFRVDLVDLATVSDRTRAEMLSNSETIL